MSPPQSVWPAVSDGFVWHRQRGHRPEPEDLMYERAQDRKSVSVAVFGVTSLQHRAQLLVDLCLNLTVSERDDQIQLRVCTVVVLWQGEGGCRASGLCKRKATVQFSQAAVVSVPPMRRSTVAMWTCTSVSTWRHWEFSPGNVSTSSKPYKGTHAAVKNDGSHHFVIPLMLVDAFEEWTCDHVCAFVVLWLHKAQNTDGFRKTTTFPSYLSSLIHGSDLHLVLVQMLLDELISPGHLPQETRKHGIGEFLAENRQQQISCHVAVSVSVSSHCTVK